jgi:serine/threonine protein kinase
MYRGNKVDIFALGVTLFNMFTGKPPFTCANPKMPVEYPLYNLIRLRRDDYWKAFSTQYWAIRDPDEKGLFPKDFKTLIFGLLAENPEKRFSITEIKLHPWYKGPVVTCEEMQTEFRKRLGPMKYEKTQRERSRMATFAFKKFQFNKRAGKK